MTKNIPTLTIGIPAYNEAHVIARLLNSIARQVLDSSKILELIVEIDGATDETFKVVSEFKSAIPELKIINGRERRGKIIRLNHIHRIFRGDILVIIDADVYLQSNAALNHLIQPILSKNTKFTHGLKKYDQKVSTIIGRGVIEREEIWLSMRNTLNHGNNIYNCSGSFSAFEKTLASIVRYPKNISSDNQYSYLASLNIGIKPIYVENAIVVSQPTLTLQDYIKQNVRLRDERNPIMAIFGSKFESEYHIPIFKKYQALFNEFLHHPILAIYAIVLDLIIKIYPGIHSSPVWDIAITTKELI